VSTQILTVLVKEKITHKNYEKETARAYGQNGFCAASNSQLARDHKQEDVERILFLPNFIKIYT